MTEEDHRDVQHILRLLSILPVPDTNDNDGYAMQFWRDLDRAIGHGHQVDSPRYILEKIRGIILVWSSRDDCLVYIGRYCLAFFAGELPDLWALVGGLFVFPAADGDPRSLGRLWASDITAAAWRLYMRNSESGSMEDVIASWNAVSP